MTTPLYPLLLTPVLHTRVWGGRNLATVMHKVLPTEQPYGESWEMHDTTIVANGALAGRSIGELVSEYGAALIGEGNKPAEGMPLLVKILDATDWLSVQVHPNDKQAKKLEKDPRGKTEAWIVLSAQAGAKLVIGVQPGITQAAMADAIQRGELEPLLVYAEVKTGDVLYVAANTVHALGPGLLIYEIQQSSDITYRLYDWNRMGLDGKPRPLHIEKGVEVSNLSSIPQIVHHPPQIAGVVVSSEYFTTMMHVLENTVEKLRTEGKFQAITCIEGTLTVRSNGDDAAATQGSTVLVPASLDSFMLIGTGRALRSFQS
jgi:mannose-6-phosphate isomerase